MKTAAEHIKREVENARSVVGTAALPGELRAYARANDRIAARTGSDRHRLRAELLRIAADREEVR